MEYTYLNNIYYPSDLKALPLEALPAVCREVRDFIIQQLSQNPGHLGSSLGTVELTVALHYVFNTPHDQLIWDVGHQAYAHKILTGRRERFHTNRQYKGIAPFPSPLESEYDAFIAGHASNSISAALGIEIGGEAIRRETGGERQRVVAVIGDGAMTGGLAFEGLNNTSMNKNNLLIVLNDNNMAIDPIKGGFTQYLVDLTTSEHYNKWRWWAYRMICKLGLINEDKKGRVQRFTNNLKGLLTKQGNNIFQGLNLRYFGPSDGHDVLNLVRIFNEIKDYEGPKVLHIITKKGKGYEPAENDQTTWHAPGEFLIETGERLKEKGERRELLWQEVFGEKLLRLAKEDARVVGVTPAMPSGCSMNIMQKELPDKVFDVGIAEAHAVTFSAGLAKAGMMPLHAWLPIAHPVAPACASSVLSGVITKAGVLAIIRVVFYQFGASFIAGTWVQIAWIILALTTVLTGSMLAYKEKVLKKRLAYSTVSQVSYILLGIFTMTSVGLVGSLLHVLAHMGIKVTLFLTAGAVLYKTHKREVNELEGIGKVMPIVITCYSLASLGLVGVPPLGGFYSKWFLASGALTSEIGALGYVACAVLLVSAILTAAYLLPIMIKGFFVGDKVIEKNEPNKLMTIPMILLVVGVFLVGIFSGYIVDYILSII